MKMPKKSSENRLFSPRCAVGCRNSVMKCQNSISGRLWCASHAQCGMVCGQKNSVSRRLSVTRCVGWLAGVARLPSSYVLSVQCLHLIWPPGVFFNCWRLRSWLLFFKTTQTTGLPLQQKKVVIVVTVVVKKNGSRLTQPVVVWIDKNQDKPLAVDANVSYEPLMAQPSENP